MDISPEKQKKVVIAFWQRWWYSRTTGFPDRRLEKRDALTTFRTLQ